MVTFWFVLLVFGTAFIGVGVMTLFDSNKIMSVFVFIGLLLVLLSMGMAIEISKRNPASLSNLTLEKFLRH